MIIKWYCHSIFVTLPCPNTERINITYKTEWQLNSVNDSTWLWKSIWQSWTAFTANHSWSFTMLQWTKIATRCWYLHKFSPTPVLPHRMETEKGNSCLCLWDLFLEPPHQQAFAQNNTRQHSFGWSLGKKCEKCEIERNNLDTATENTETNTKHEDSLA